MSPSQQGAAASEHRATAKRNNVRYTPKGMPAPDLASARDPYCSRDLWSRRLWREWRRRAIRIVGLVATDVVVLAVAFVSAASLARTGGDRTLMPLAIVSVMMGLGLVGSYRAAHYRRSGERLALAVLAGIATLVMLSASLPVASLGIGQLTIFGGLALGTLMIGRWIAERIVRVAHHRGLAIRRTLIVGHREDAWEIVEHYRHCEERSLSIIGHVSPMDEDDPTALGSVATLGGLIGAHEVDHVIVAGRLTPAEYRAVSRECLLRGATVSVISAVPLRTEEITMSRRDVAGWPALQIRVPRDRMLQVAAKRALDVMGAGLLVLLLSPVYAALALAVKLDSPGPVFFRQRRPGLGGRPFGMLKFRSMRGDAEQVLQRDPALYRRFVENGCKLPAEEDPRITKLGRFIRRTSLDELPQLFNVLRGEMSLVGPRPVVGPELQQFGEYAPVVLAVKPGMTGHWQVSGRSTVGIPERARLDYEYVTDWSLYFDMCILAKTLPAVLRKTGAH